MMTLPPEMVAVVAAFAPLFSHSVWLNAQLLIWGTLLARGPRTVTAALRATGREQEPTFCNAHRVLSRACWSGLRAASPLLLLTLRFVPGTQILIAIDDSLERRRGSKISSLGVFRDPISSSRAHQSKSVGLRWVVASAIVSVPWARRPWALPILSVLSPPPPFQTRKSKAAKAAKKAGTRYLPPKTKRPKAKGAMRSRVLSTADRPRQGARRHKTTVDRAGQIMSWLGRVLRHHRIVVVMDGAYAAHKLVSGAARRGTSVVTRLHWDAQLYEVRGEGEGTALGARARSPRERLEGSETEWEEVEVGWYGGQRKRIRMTSFEAMWTKGHRCPVRVRVVLTSDERGERGTTREECFVSTQMEASAEQIVEWFVMRWSEEVTFEEARRHLGVESQRGWSRKTIERSTPVLLGLFTLVTVMTQALVKEGKVPVRRAAWYDKKEATFSDCLALVRRQILRARFLESAPHLKQGADPQTADIIEALLDALPLTA